MYRQSSRLQLCSPGVRVAVVTSKHRLRIPYPGRRQFQAQDMGLDQGQGHLWRNRQCGIPENNPQDTRAILGIRSE